jgi:hypothetical protein
MRTISDILKNTKYNEHQIEYFLAECLYSYEYFAEHVLGFEVADYHKEWTELMETFPRLCIEAYRGSGKTNWIVGHDIWESIFNENLSFLIVSNSFEQSKTVLKLIRKMIHDNELLRQFMPEGKESTWKATELELKTGCTFYCRTYGEGVKGLRIDRLFCDEAGQYEDKTIFWAAISPVVQLNRGRIRVVGTPESTIDLLSDLKKNDEYMFKEYPVMKDDKVLWPQKYTLNENDTVTQRSILKIRKEIGELPFMQEYLLVPISSANSLFPWEILMPNVSDEEKFLPFGRKDERYYIGYDLAVSKHGDFTVMVVIGVTSDRKRIVKALRFRDDFQDQKRRLRQLVADFHPIKIVVDATTIGDQQARELAMELGNVEALKITYDEKLKMVLDLRQEFEKFNLVIPNSKEDLNTYSFSQQMLKELNEFNLKMDLRAGQTTRPKFHSGENDDCVIALALANRASQNIYGEVSLRGI